MTLQEAIALRRDHQKDNLRYKTRRSHHPPAEPGAYLFNYDYLFRNMQALFGEAAVDAISSQDLHQFLLILTGGRGRS